jgi:ABC-type uncharacterized transport system involved in gliding motility auxiliary subunit
MNKEYAKIAGWSGLALLLAAGISYATRGIADWTLWAPLALGLASALWWLSVFRTEAAEVILRRRTRQGANSLVLSLAVLTILVLVQAIIVAHDKSWDLTNNKEHTLSDELVKAVKNLDEPVDVKAFFGPDGREGFEELLGQAKLQNPSKFSYEFINPNKEGLLAKDLGVRSFGTSVVESGDKRESITSTKEEDLVNAIVKVSSGIKKSVYVLTGHQEASLGDTQQFGVSAMKTALENATFMTHELNLVAGGQGKVEVPEDAAALIVPGPRLDIPGPELDAMTRYLGRGGRIFVSLDPRQHTPGLLAWLAKDGVVMDDDIVIELNPYNQLMNLGPESALVQTFDRSHPATRDLASQGGTAVFTLARTVSLGKLPAVVTGTVLARSLGTAYGWKGAGNQPPRKPGPGDLKGPLDLMVSVEGPVSAFGGDASDKKARLVAIGNTGALGNAWMANPSTANQALFLNCVRWLADEEKRIALPPKPQENSPIILDAGRASLIRWVMFLLLAATLGTGVAVGRARRRASV